jgi:hypothetical protein
MLHVKMAECGLSGWARLRLAQKLRFSAPRKMINEKTTR